MTDDRSEVLGRIGLTLRKRKWVILLLVLIVDLVLSNFPGPVPTEQAVFNAEHDPTFQSVTTRVINGSVIHGSYYYFGYSNDPARDFFCVNNLYSSWLHYLNPFHEYTTTTLVFAVTFQTHPEPPYNVYGINLFLQVNPTTGQIYDVQQSSQCTGPGTIM